MMGNFFQVTCPYLFQLDTVAYFPVIRGRHAHETIDRIRATTQLLLDVYHHGDDWYVQPLKAWERHSPTMFQPHKFQGEELVPLTDGHAMAAFNRMREEMPDTVQHLDSWERFFMLAHMKFEQNILSQQDIDAMCRMIMTRDDRMVSLIQKHFRAEDYFKIRNRMIGSGNIGGKACGMLLSRRIVKNAMTDYAEHFEPHDSFFIGSDVFYTYVVTNQCWNMRILQKTDDGYFTAAAELKERLFSGVFPQEIEMRFREMLDYY